MLMAAVLTLLSLLLAMRVLAGFMPPTSESVAKI
jgi:hypothetical protein